MSPRPPLADYLGRRLTPEQERTPPIPFDYPCDYPCELGYRCPVHLTDWDESLEWSEWAGHIWCPICDRDWPSVMCVDPTRVRDPDRTWIHAGLDSVEQVLVAHVRQAVGRVTIDRQAES